MRYIFAQFAQAGKNWWFHSGSILKHKSPQLLWVPRFRPPFPTVAIFHGRRWRFRCWKATRPTGGAVRGQSQCPGKAARKKCLQTVLFVRLYIPWIDVNSIYGRTDISAIIYLKFSLQVNQPFTWLENAVAIDWIKLPCFSILKAPYCAANPMVYHHWHC